MTSHGSWIDQDEINRLVNSIDDGKNKTPTPEPVEEKPQPAEDEGFSFSFDDEAEENASEPSRQPQVVKALAEVRNRADRGGLLRATPKGATPLWPDFPPLDEEKPEKPETEEIPDESIAEIAVTEKISEKPIPLRKRLEDFADSTVSKFDATGLSITDFSGYQLLQRGSEDSIELSAATSLVTDQVNRLSQAVGAPELGSTQISLGNDRWLCLVEAESATGGIVAQLQIPEPMDSSATSRFREDLEAVLVGG